MNDTMTATREAIHVYRPQFRVHLPNGDYLLRETENEAITELACLAAIGIDATLEPIAEVK
jgi:hypothetical protein